MKVSTIYRLQNNDGGIRPSKLTMYKIIAMETNQRPPWITQIVMEQRILNF